MPAAILQLLSRKVRLAQEAPNSSASPWSRAALAGRLIEVSGMGSLTVVVSLVYEAQRSGDPCAWVTRADQHFFPPDVAAHGVDLACLPVIIVSSTREAVRAAARLVRSDAFGLVVIDLTSTDDIPMPLQGRLTGLAHHHDATIAFVTQTSASASSLGSMISLRVESHRQRVDEGRFRIRLEALKDKRHGPGWAHDEVAYGPPGLR